MFLKSTLVGCDSAWFVGGSALFGLIRRGSVGIRTGKTWFMVVWSGVCNDNLIYSYLLLPSADVDSEMVL